MQTAQALLPMLERKTGRKVYIDREPALSQTRSMGSAESVLKNGRENVALLNKYSRAEYGLFVAHAKIIAATSLAIAEHAGIDAPEFLRVYREIDQSSVTWAMREFGLDRQEAEEKVRKYSMTPSPEIPPIAEASAICIDLERREIEYIFAC